MVRVGIIGAGFMGGMHAQCYKQLNNAKLVAVADAQAEKAGTIAGKYGAKVYTSGDELIASCDVDAVDICLPTYMHMDYTVKSAKAKKHVICEKPIALNLKEADAMIGACAKAKVKFMVAQVLRFWPEYMKLKEIKDSNSLGRLISMTCRRLGAEPVWSWQKWMSDPGKSGGALIDLHIHDVDFLYYIFGKPVSVCSVGTQAHIWSCYRFKGKGVGFAEGGWDVGPKYPFTATFTAVFEKGTVDFDCRQEKTLAVFTADGVEHPAVEAMAAEDAGGNISVLGGYYNEIKYFIDCVDSNQKLKVVTAKDARNSLEIIMFEKKSAETGRAVSTD